MVRERVVLERVVRERVVLERMVRERVVLERVVRERVVHDGRGRTAGGSWRDRPAA